MVRGFESLGGAKKNPCKQLVYKGLWGSFLFSAEREVREPTPLYL